MKKANLELTETEANELVSLLDLAVKAGGLQVAPKAVAWLQKISTAFAVPPANLD